MICTKRFLIFAIILTFMTNVMPITYAEENLTYPANYDETSENSAVLSVAEKSIGYREYRKLHTADKGPNIEVDVIQYKQSNGEIALKDNIFGITGTALLIEEEANVSYTVSVPQDGYYALKITYYNIEGRGGAIECAFYKEQRFSAKTATAI